MIKIQGSTDVRENTIFYMSTFEDFLSCAIQMTRVDPGNHVLDGVQILPMGRGNFEGGKRRPYI